MTSRKSNILLSCSTSNCKYIEWRLNNNLINDSNIERYGNNGLWIKSVENDGKYSCICITKNYKIHHTITHLTLIECNVTYNIDIIEISMMMITASIIGIILGLCCSYQNISYCSFNRF